MPELPEVETIKNELLPHVKGRRITDVEIRRDSTVRGMTPAEFKSCLIGRRIEDLERHGKYLIFDLDNGEFLAMHMKLSGSLWAKASEVEVPDYVKAVLTLDNGEKIFLRDPRAFARMWLVDDICEITDKLGPEPLTKEFTPDVLAERLKGKSAPIKSVLIDQAVIAGIGNMYADEILYAAKIDPRRLKGKSAPIKSVLIDQAVIAGIGNMYADEILYAAKIDPRRAARSLSREETERIHQAIRTILPQAIASKGASVQDYFRPSGEAGMEQFNFKVAHRKKATCPCGGPIERIVVRGRGTYFCPNCEKSMGDFIKEY
jgi:formamidopyrimidine-DNA glycosylase